jgi:transposase-like protein
MNLMLINLSTRRFARAVRPPEGDIPSLKGDGVSKSAVSRRFVALVAAQLKTWMQTDLSKLDLPVIQIDGIHVEQDLVLLAAVGVDAEGNRHPLGVMEGATENVAVVQALLDNLIDHGLEEIEMQFAPAADFHAVLGAGDGGGQCQQHHLRQWIHHLPGLAGVLQGREVFQQRLTAR